MTKSNMSDHDRAVELFAFCVAVVREGGDDELAIGDIAKELRAARDQGTRAALADEFARRGEGRDAWVQSYAERILISWCANPQMFAEGAHVPYSSLLVNAREIASLAWVMKQKPCADSAELRTEAEYAGLAISESMFPDKKGGLRG